MSSSTKTIDEILKGVQVQAALPDGRPSAIVRDDAKQAILEAIDQARPKWHQDTGIDGVAWFNAGANHYQDNLLQLLGFDDAGDGRNGGK